MSAVRTPADSRDRVDGIVITDQDGDVLQVERFTSDADRFAALLSIRGDTIGLTLEDGLTLLSYIADALGVERYVPAVEECNACGGDLQTGPVVEAGVVEWCHAPIRRPGGGS